MSRFSCCRRIVQDGLSACLIERTSLSGVRMAGTVVESAAVSRRDLDALCWVGEQYAVRADQLVAWLDCNPRTVQRLIARLREQRLAEVRRLLVGEPAWVIPTVRGCVRVDCRSVRGSRGLDRSSTWRP